MVSPSSVNGALWRVRGSDLLAVFSSHIFKNDIDFREKAWNFLFHYVPHDINVDTKIIMYQFVSCSSNVLPWNIRIICFYFFRQKDEHIRVIGEISSGKWIQES